ncbi:MAG: TlpA disulfide reductase family protein [Bacteroidales bacterium]|jgi:cytochrome c biogenesis protein CcmG/thiol:disulfide interchange protein DsbE|nr:TlpA disulfide reductase family protein [Bacteroidales bacterium]
MMKQLILLLSFFTIIGTVSAQEIPSVQLKTLDQQTVQSTDVIVNENDGPVLLCFWATYCKPCVKELSTYNELYPDWEDETGVKIILVSIDNARSVSRVAPFVNGKAWDFDVFIDTNSDLKRAMNVINVPHTFLLDAEGNVVWQHTAFMDGDEEKVYEELLKLSESKE